MELVLLKIIKTFVREGQGKKSESPYLSLKTDFTWVFEMEQLPTPRQIFSPWVPTARGSESPDTLLPNL